jgi:hypothetical protein
MVKIDASTLEVQRIREDGYLPLSTDTSISPTFGELHEVAIATSFKHNNALHGELNEHLFKIDGTYISNITTIVNSRQKLRMESFDPGMNYRYLYQPTNNEDNLARIAIEVLCENVKSLNLNTWEKQFVEVKSRLATVGIRLPYGVKRFLSIRQASLPSLEEFEVLVAIANESFRSNVDLSKLIHLCVDESIVESEPGMKKRQRSDPEKEKRNFNLLKETLENPQSNSWQRFQASIGLAPIVNMGKPHSGMFMAGLSVKSTKTKIPFILHFIPALGDKHCFIDDLKQFISIFPNTQQISLTLDARYSSNELFYRCTRGMKLRIILNNCVQFWFHLFIYLFIPIYPKKPSLIF